MKNITKLFITELRRGKSQVGDLMIHTSHTEIINNIHRLTVAPKTHFEFNQFLIIDEKTCLVHAGKEKLFEPLKKLVKKTLNGKKLDYIVFSHVEADESGAVNLWLTEYPQAQVICNKIANINLEDFLIRPAHILKDGELLNLGNRNLKLVETPHFPHNWDAHMWYVPEDQILFSSDFCCQGGICEPVMETDITPDIIDFYDKGQFIPYGKTTNEALKKIEALPLKAIVPMHGSTILGNVCNYTFQTVKSDLVMRGNE